MYHRSRLSYLIKIKKFSIFFHYIKFYFKFFPRYFTFLFDLSNYLRKSLIKEILKQYPTVNELELKNIIKVKESDIIFSKITTHDSTDMVVYFIDKIPYFFKFEKDNQLLPSGNCLPKV